MPLFKNNHLELHVKSTCLPLQSKTTSLTHISILRIKRHVEYTMLNAMLNTPIVQRYAFTILLQILLLNLHQSKHRLTLYSFVDRLEPLSKIHVVRLCVCLWTTANSYMFKRTCLQLSVNIIYIACLKWVSGIVL